ncbi:MAG: aspartate carbamoyltransferase regulatory subunit [Muribaculaceae bacterium]|nr:aspartate carbamoyltransferase regulatory subunit [Muribaculaceae bacterium]
MPANKQLAVAALENGTVIDHIPADALFKCVKILGVENLSKQLTIGNNLHSRKLGTKGIIKIADVSFPEETINRVALVAPTAVINTIRDFAVVDKRPVQLPRQIVGIVRCSNPKCITNNEPMRTRFNVIDFDTRTIQCHYCGVKTNGAKADII